MANAIPIKAGRSIPPRCPQSAALFWNAAFHALHVVIHRQQFLQRHFAAGGGLDGARLILDRPLERTEGAGGDGGFFLFVGLGGGRRDGRVQGRHLDHALFQPAAHLAGFPAARHDGLGGRCNSRPSYWWWPSAAPWVRTWPCPSPSRSHTRLFPAQLAAWPANRCSG